MKADDYIDGIRLLDHILYEAGYSPIQLGRGAEYDSDIFTMNPYLERDCDCGRQDAEWEWTEKNTHRSQCFISELEQHLKACGELDFEAEHQEVLGFARKHGVDEVGIRLHCTCDYQERYRAAGFECSEQCSLEQPNFLHKETGLRIEWYKCIGRGMESRNDVTARQWAQIVSECLQEVLGAPRGEH